MKWIVLIFFFQTAAANGQVTSKPLVLRGAWEESIKGPQPIYGCADGISRSYIDEIIFRSPNPIALIPAFLDLVVEFTDDDAKRIAADCRQKFSEPFALTGCVSRGVNEHFSDKVFVEANTSCRSHAKGFNLAFKALGIPRSNSSDLSVIGKIKPDCTNEIGHVLNRVTLVGEDGQPYSYAIDSGILPGEAFPLTKMTVDYHKKNRQFPELFTPDCEQCTQKKSPFSPLREMLQFINND